MNGWTGKIAEIDLTRRLVSVIEPGSEIYEKYIGGRGLSGYFLRPYAHLPWDSQDMPLLFFTGPLVATESPTSGRMTIMSKSPLTGAVGDSSVGGRLGTEIKRAGWDGIVVKGKSSSLTGIKISDKEIEFVDAGSLKGRTTGEIFDILKPEGSLAVTGPAAENRVMFSNICVDRRYFAGRCGIGLSMDAKNLKYIDVKGTGSVEVFDRDGLKKANESILRLVSASPFLAGELGISEYGTGSLYDLVSSRRMMPVDNFRSTFFENADKMNAFAFRKKYRTVKDGCAGCHILCKKSSIEGEPVPEFQAMAHFSALINNSSIETVMEANRLCNEFGMDTISAASAIACYSEINSLKPDIDSILSLLKDMAYSENTGSELKAGSYRYAEMKGRPEASMSVKGLDLPAFDPRGAYGTALSYATSTRGGCSNRASAISHEILRKPVATDRFTFSGKARIIRLNEDTNAVSDSLTACRFIFFAASVEEYSKAYQAVTGSGADSHDLLVAGERIFINERIMNSINGFGIESDTLPERFFSSPGTSGPGIDVPPLNRDEFVSAVEKYYSVRGLDKNGMPLNSKIRELGLD